MKHNIHKYQSNERAHVKMLSPSFNCWLTLSILSIYSVPDFVVHLFLHKYNHKYRFKFRFKFTTILFDVRCINNKQNDGYAYFVCLTLSLLWYVWLLACLPASVVNRFKLFKREWSCTFVKLLLFLLVVWLLASYLKCMRSYGPSGYPFLN